MLGLVFLLTGELLHVAGQAAFLIDVNQIGAVLRFTGAAILTVAMIGYHLPVLRTVTRKVLSAVLTTLISGGLIFIGILVVLTVSQQEVRALRDRVGHCGWPSCWGRSSTRCVC
jgi:hypothetical protein